VEYIITFKNTNFAIKAEQRLLEQKLQVSVLPLPSQINAGCGICLRINQAEIREALKTLADRQISEIGLFSRMPENSRFSYEELEAACFYQAYYSPTNRRA